MRVVDMVVDLRDRLGEYEDFDTTSATEWSSHDVGNHWRNDFLVRKLQEGARRFNREMRWPWLVTAATPIALASGTSEISLPPDVDFGRTSRLELVPTTDTSVLILPERVSAMTALDLRSLQYTAGDPQYYSLLSSSKVDTNVGAENQASTIVGKAKLLPVPDRAFTVNFMYYRNQVALGRLDEPDVPEAYQDAIIAYAEFKAWGKEHTAMGRAKAEDAYGEYARIVEQAKNEVEGLAEGEKLAWGNKPPRFVARDEASWVKRHLPINLGA